MSKEKRFVIQVDPLEIEDDAIFDNKELMLYECRSDMMSDICSLLNQQDQRIAELQKQLEEKDKKIEILQTHFKKTQELLAREMGNSNIVIDNLQKEMKQALANQKEYYEKRLKFIAKDIMENIRRELGLKLKYKLNDEVYVLKICNQINEVLDTILKEYQK